MIHEPFLKQLEFHVRSANSGLWVISHETEEVLRTTLQLKLPCQGEEDLPIIVLNWDASDGGRDLSVSPPKQVLPSDPIKALNTFRIRAQEKKENEVQILVLQNFHLALEHPVVKQTFINAVQEGKANGLIYLVVSPKTEMPLELQHLITQLDFKPPTKEEIQSIALCLNEGETEDLLNNDAVIDAMLGLTRREIEQALALGCIRDSFRSPSDPNRLRLLTEDLWDSKDQILKQKPFLKLLRSQRGFDQLGGLKGIKKFLTKLLQPDDLPPKGVLLIGPPGTGKSVLAKSLGYETQRAVVQLDLGACYNKHVGESEANIRDALNSIEAMGKVCLFVD